MNIQPMELIVILVMCLPVLLVMAMAVVLITRRRDQLTASRVRCPHCAEWIMPQAKVCRYCGRSLGPEGHPTDG
ncbi:MAG: hypothetical protein MUE67_06440 [Anaerolineales bacterium]|jgi:hypothetical protein|nr:hypothetical protein [Anaerolineales bacterium]